MKKLSVLFMGIIVIGALLSFGIAEEQAFAEETFKFKIAFPGSPNTYNSRAHLWWAKEVERRTNGKVKMEPYFGGSLGTHQEMVKLVGSGAVEIGASVWAPYNPQLFPLHSVTDGPVIWSKNPIALVYAGMQLEKKIPEVAAENTKLNMKRLTWQGAGTTNIITRKIPIRTLEDLKGLQIRTAGKFLQPPLLKAIGAVSVGVPMPGLYDALQKNIVDGSTGSMSLFVGYKLYEVGKYITIIGIGGDPGEGLMINLDLWNRLPKDVQQVMTDLYENEFPRAAIEQFAVPDYKKSVEIFKKNGVEVIDFPDGELEKWKGLVPLDQHVAPWVEFAAKTSGQPESKVREILKTYTELIQHYEKEYSSVLKELLF